MKAAGALYYPWGSRGLPSHQVPGPDELLVRLVSSFATREQDVDRFIAIAKMVE